MPMTDEQLARLFHETHRRMAFKYNLKTDERSWAELPELDRVFLAAVCGEILDYLRDNPMFL